MLSIIVSVYNEEAVLERFYSAFQAIRTGFSWPYELLFVNDGSTDASARILEEIARGDPCVRVVSFSRNFGHEAAMIAGIDKAKGDRLICMDADLQHPLECILPIMKKFDEGFEIISMVRVANRSAGPLKNLTSRAFYKVMNVLSDQVAFTENASDFFAISDRVAEVLRTGYREKVRFLRGYVQSVGFKRAELTYAAAERAGGASHYSFKSLLRLSVNTIICFSTVPLKLGIYFGFLCAVFGVAVLIYTFFTYQNAPSGYATIVTLICFLFAALFMIIGIIGQYLAVLFAELKDRPIYIVSKEIDAGCQSNG